jgi:transcriptional regulator CtsR
MGRISWFSEEGDDLFFQRYIDRMESWQQAIADGRIDPEEVRAQAERVAALLREIEPQLSDALHEQVTQLLLELAVLNAMQTTLFLQNPA